MKREIIDYTTVDITTLIITVRGNRVILDADLARIYGVPTKRLNERSDVTEIGSRLILLLSLQIMRLQT